VLPLLLLLIKQLNKLHKHNMLLQFITIKSQLLIIILQLGPESNMLLFNLLWRIHKLPLLQHLEYLNRRRIF
jgi:hypothetical protein